ncbi:MAG: ketohydroxyglutarate aldolase [Acetobacteraceae bacterium]|nr:ketohydroxyglutarate aldolase [Acetobacteraceae bacterium]
MAEVKVSVSVDDSHLERLDEVARAAEAAGMTVHGRQATIGVLTGSIAQDKLDKLRSVPGVEDVETQREVRVPPPDSEVQ